jgi:hypothetical protein
MRQLVALAVVLLVVISGCWSDDGSAGKDKSVKEPPPPPCHPGCFPAGTPIATPDGQRPIDAIRRGDVITLVREDGTSTSGRVDSTFQTCTGLVEVQTDLGRLLTTATQPLCLAAGGFRRAGELIQGEEIWRFEQGQRRPARVQGVVPAEKDAAVFNLVVGESAVFIAGGFLARGKPPADAE